jgi:hypothetical protein
VSKGIRLSIEKNKDEAPPETKQQAKSAPDSSTPDDKKTEPKE